MRTEYSNWRKLDNAALAFPLVTGENDTRVFRFYCQLKEEVDSDILQQALLFGRDIKRVKARFFKPFLQKMRLADALANNVKCYSRHRLVCAIVCNHESNTAAVKPIGNMQNLHKLLLIPS